jgi:hypothetical protein
MEGMKKTLSIAPSFDCSLKCEGCYLTTDVTKDMRKATKDDYYWKRVLALGVRYGYKEVAMTLNPFPGAIEKCIEHAKWAKEAGFESVNVTVTWGDMMEAEQITELLGHIDVLSESIDENRDITLSQEYLIMFPNIHYNINLLWSEGVFNFVTASGGKPLQNVTTADKWCVKRMALQTLISAREQVLQAGVTCTMQHLILKPLSLYPSGGWFQENYGKVLELDWLSIAGDGYFHIGDLAYGNMMGLNACPGNHMMDIDPMGMVRRCPENPITHEGDTLLKLELLMQRGIPGCGLGCDCITPT